MLVSREWGWNLIFLGLCSGFGSFEVYWYAFFIVLAIAISMIAFKRKDGQFGVRFDDVFDLSLFVLPVSVVSARIYYVVFSPDGYGMSMSEILEFRRRRNCYLRGYYSADLLRRLFSAGRERLTFGIWRTMWCRTWL